VAAVRNLIFISAIFIIILLCYLFKESLSQHIIIWTFQYSDIFYLRKFFQVCNLYFVHNMFRRVLSTSCVDVQKDTVKYEGYALVQATVNIQIIYPTQLDSFLLVNLYNQRRKGKFNIF